MHSEQEQPSTEVYASERVPRVVFGANRPGASEGIRAGLLSGAATSGILIGLGWRHGTALQPFAGAGRVLLGSPSSRLPELLLVVVGLALHLVLAMLAGWVTIAFMRRLGARLVVAAVCVTLLAWVATAWVLPESLRAVTADLSRPEQLLFFSVLGVTLWFGIRLAFEAQQLEG